MMRLSMRSLTASVIAHITVVLLLIIIPWILNWRERRKKPHEIITYVDLRAAPSMPSAPVAADIKEAPPPPPKPKDIPPPPKKKKKKIEVSKKRIKRQDKPPPKKTKPQLTEEEIRKLLAQGQSFDATAGTPAPGDLPAWYYALVRQTFFDKWNQPSGLAVTPGDIVRVSIRVARNGNIMERRMVKSSGITVMDESVMQAVSSISKLKALPPEYQGNHKDIIIDFELTGTGY